MKILLPAIFLCFAIKANAEAASVHPAETVLEAMLKAFEGSDASAVGKDFDETMIGLSQLQESVKTALGSQKQIKVKLGAKRFTKAKDIYVIQCDWEKTYLASSSLSPKKVHGRTLFLFQFKDKQWKLASMSGDNIFSF